MPHAQSSDSDSVSGGDKVVRPFTAKILSQFYEAPLLLKALMEVYPARASDDQDIESCLSDNLDDDPEQTFRKFLNAVALICDSRLGGETVTAFVVLQKDCARVQYRFASNCRTQEALNATKEHVTDIFRGLGTLGPDVRTGDTQVEQAIFHDILVFNRQRVTGYIKLLAQQAARCVTLCDELAPRVSPADANNSSAQSVDEGPTVASLLDTATAAVLGRALEMVHTCAEDCLPPTQQTEAEEQSDSLEDMDFTTKCQKLMVLLLAIHSKPTCHSFIQRRARNTNDHLAAEWSELRHAMGRLLSYAKAMGYLIHTARTSPELFHNFEVISIPSSEPYPSPISQKEQSLEHIMSRMPQDFAREEIWREHREKTDVARVNAEIVKKKSFRPYVHAEVLLEDSLQRDPYGGGPLTKAADFYNQWRYIGCSKPTCRMCELYFQKKGSPVALRQGHGNLYLQWRVPDVLEKDDAWDTFVKAQRQTMMKMLAQMCEDVSVCLRERISTRKKHDSNTSSTNRVGTSLTGWLGEGGSCGGLDLVREHLGQSLNAGSVTVRGKSGIVPALTVETVGDIVIEDEEDGHGGVDLV